MVVFACVRVGCILEELCDEVGRAFEGDGLTGRCLRCRHVVSRKEGGSRGWKRVLTPTTRIDGD